MGQLTQTTAQVQDFLDNVALNPMTAVGDLMVGGSNGNPTRLAKGTAGQVLLMNNSGTAVEWGTPGGSGSSPTIIELSVSGTIFDVPSGGYTPYSSSATFSFADPNMTVQSIYSMMANGDDIVATFTDSGTTFYMKPYAQGMISSNEMSVDFCGVATGSYADCYKCWLDMFSDSSGSTSISFYYTPYSVYTPS